MRRIGNTTLAIGMSTSVNVYVTPPSPWDCSVLFQHSFQPWVQGKWQQKMDGWTPFFVCFTGRSTQDKQAEQQTHKSQIARRTLSHSQKSSTRHESVVIYTSHFPICDISLSQNVMDLFIQSFIQSRKISVMINLVCQYYKTHVITWQLPEVYHCVW